MEGVRLGNAPRAVQDACDASEDRASRPHEANESDEAEGASDAEDPIDVLADQARGTGEVLLRDRE